jgi:hypothetical protein
MQRGEWLHALALYAGACPSLGDAFGNTSSNWQDAEAYLKSSFDLNSMESRIACAMLGGFDQHRDAAPELKPLMSRAEPTISP